MTAHTPTVPLLVLKQRIRKQARESEDAARLRSALSMAKTAAGIKSESAAVYAEQFAAAHEQANSRRENEGLRRVNSTEIADEIESLPAISLIQDYGLKKAHARLLKTVKALSSGQP